MSNHTPGPWYWEELCLRGQNGDCILYCDGFSNMPGEDDKKLIAAAPDLLEALERLAAAAECRDNTTGDPARLIEVRAELAAAAQQARDALVAARGGKA